ncbi:MAG: OB-fold nucleic acid binding domain-containing protein, partial [bacterium]|nr:OB-fold nucleic acid binding domain-containing protein [bacterium]
KQKEEDLGQTSLFSGLEAGGKPVGLKLKDTLPWAENEKLALEKEAMGFYFSGHPLKLYEAEIRRVATSDTKLCQTAPSQTDVKLAGMVAATKVITTKKGARMAFLTFEDLKGSVEVIVFSDVYQKVADLLGQDVPMVLTGQVERGEEGVKIMARELVSLTDFLGRKTQSVHFKIQAKLFTEERIHGLNRILSDHPGACKAFIHLLIPGESETVMELPKGVDLSSEAVVNKINVLFQNRIVEYNI